MNKTLYVLGAGVSLNCGMPTVDKITSKLKEEILLLAMLEHAKNINEMAYMETIVKGYEINKLFENIDIEKGNFDDIWSGLTKEKQKKLQSKYYWFFWHKKNNAMHSSVAMELFARYLENDATIISFNYDIFLESALNNIFANRFDYNYMIDKNAKKGINIVKPLGSINWILLEGSEIPNNTRPLIEFRTTSKLYEIDSYVKYTNNDEDAINEISVFRPSIRGEDTFFCRYGKEISEMLWQRTFEQLEYAEKVVVIGYSFATVKIDGKILFDTNASCNVKKFRDILLTKKLEIVNPDVELINKIGKNSTEALTFEKWLMNIYNDKATDKFLTPEEKEACRVLFEKNK